MRAALILVFAAVTPMIGQTPPKQHTDTLEALLVEVRQLRQDVESMRRSELFMPPIRDYLRMDYLVRFCARTGR
jgi:hypothetical protein